MDAGDAKSSDAAPATPAVSLDLKDAEAKLVEVARDVQDPSCEFFQVEKEFKAAVNGRIDDYVAHRIKRDLPPIGFRLVYVERVSNPVLEARFAQRAKQQQAAFPTRSPAELRERYAFHGTRPANVPKICNKGLLRVGHALNPSQAIDEGYFGMPQHGVSVSRCAGWLSVVSHQCATDADYTFKYSNALDALLPKEQVGIVMLRVLPGRSRHIEKRTPGLKPSDSPGYDSHRYRLPRCVRSSCTRRTARPTSKSGISSRNRKPALRKLAPF